MRNTVLFASLAMFAWYGPSVQAQSCRCGGACPSAQASQAVSPTPQTASTASQSAAAIPQDRVFWEPRSSRYLFYTTSAKTWYYWKPTEKQWAVAPASSPTSAPAAPAKPLPLVAESTRRLGEGRHAATLPVVAKAPYNGQKTCPVMDEELGGHGTPIAVTVRGHTVYVCCKGCIKRVQADPDKYLAKISQERQALSTEPTVR